MKLFLVFVIAFTVLFLHPVVLADSATGMPDEDLEVLAKRGKGVVTQEMFVARADRIPANVRQQTLRNSSRFEAIINSLVLRAQLAEDARLAGFGKRTVIASRMKLAADWELADAWLQHFVATQPAADYEQLAHEYYQLHPAEFRTPVMVNVSHILVSTKERTEPEALTIIEMLYLQLVGDSSLFDDLVKQYSEDSSVDSNQGKFYDVKKGDMVTPYEVVAFALEQDEISQPVLTKYGYHIIRLDKHIATRVVDFKSVKLQLIEAEREHHLTQIRQEYLQSLNSQKLEMTQAAMREMIRRVFDEDFINSQAGGGVDSG